MALDTRIALSIKATQTGGADLVGATAPLNLVKNILLTNGTGVGQGDRMWSDQRTVTASATDSVDLSGTLTDAFGATLTFAKIKAVYVEALSTNTNNVVVTRPASNGVPLFAAAGDALALRPSESFFWGGSAGAGVTVTAGTGDLIDFVNSAGGSSVVYNVVVIGTSA